MHYTANDLDTDTLAKAANEALTRPDSTAVWDDRLWRTHGCMHSWADRGDDLIAESNHHVMLAQLRTVERPDEDDVVDTSFHHWLVGSMTHIFVRIYNDTDEDGDPIIESGYTPAFRVAVACALSISEYPLLDESDYSERESKAQDALIEDALSWASRGDDTPEQIQEITNIFWDLLRDSSDEVSWEGVVEMYTQARDQFFAQRA